MFVGTGWTAGCGDDDDDGDDGGVAGSAGTSAGTTSGGTSSNAGAPSAGAPAAGDGAGGAGGSVGEAGAGGDALGGTGGSLGGAGGDALGGAAGSPSGGAGGDGGAGGATTGCAEGDFTVLGEPPSCVACGTYHYTTHAPTFDDVCDVFGTGHYFDEVEGKLYLEAKAGFPEPKAWTILRGVGETSDVMHLIANFPDEPPACAAQPFAIQVSVDGEYLVADVSAAMACADGSSVDLIGQFAMGSLSYGCAGGVTTRIAIDFGINASPTTVTVSCLSGDGLEPKKVNGPPP